MGLIRENLRKSAAKLFCYHPSVALVEIRNLTKVYPLGESLFGGIDLSGLRTRWDDVQAAFVDDPRECVQKADRLVSDVVDQLTTGFADARSRLEEQWSRGQEASTEDLRQALKRYREFFQRLLAVS